MKTERDLQITTNNSYFPLVHMTKTKEQIETAKVINLLLPVNFNA